MFDKLKTKFLGDKLDKNLLYSYLYVQGSKYGKNFDIYLLTEEQNTFALNPIFVFQYNKKLIIVELEANYVELVDMLRIKYRIPEVIISNLNGFLETNRALFTLYYHSAINRIETLKQIRK